MKIIRELLDLSQAQIAALTGVDQTTVSRWEREKLEPNRQQMMKIREAAMARGVEWKDEWFFDPASLPSELRGESTSV